MRPKIAIRILRLKLSANQAESEILHQLPNNDYEHRTKNIKIIILKT